MNQRETELLKALRAVRYLIDEGDLVRDISKDDDFMYFVKQGGRINDALVLMNEAIKNN